MRSRRKTTFGLVLAGLLVACPAAAQEFSSSPDNTGLFGIFDEVRTGGSFSVQPNDDSGLILRGELLFRSFVRPFDNYFADTLLRPRVHIGGNLATASDGVSQVYSGLTWDFPIYRDFFLEATFGFTVHNGPLESPGDGLDLGCHLLFRESIGAGINLGEHWRVIAAADHSSHAHLICAKGSGNSGITHAGVFVGYRF
jgi:lipid A 3-O-deacylase